MNVGGDTIAEPNEHFFVNLAHPVGATVTSTQGTGTIIDDDAQQSPVVEVPVDS